MSALVAPSSFRTPEGLRALLKRLHDEGDSAWRRNVDVTALMEYTAGRYAGLARKHGLDPWEAASAAFDAMRTSSVRNAEDPWAVVTRAVQVTLIAEERGNGLLCSTHQARRPQYSGFHDPERFSDRENPLTDYHEALHVAPAGEGGSEPHEEATGVVRAVEDAIKLLTLLDWPEQTARAAVEHICTRLGAAPSRASAAESLRRDRHARAVLDLSSSSWSALLRAILGNTDPDQAHTAVGRGVLFRLLVGEPLRALLTDDDLVLLLGLNAPLPAGVS
ncbi:MAG: hypothetical protein AB7L91_15215 [Dehalococcoidia bacterium]